MKKDKVRELGGLYDSGQKSDRLSIRTSTSEKDLLAKAAQLRHMNVSQFILQASLREAEQVIEEERKLVVSEADYAWLLEVMDKATDVPRLREAIAMKPAWHE